jgi:hypothetical protein
MINLKELDYNALQKLLTDTQKELTERGPRKEMEFDFWCAGTKKRKPYVAKLSLNKAKLQRDFYEMQEKWEDSEYIVEGKYKAKVGDILEKRVGDNGITDILYWCVVTEDGEKEFQIFNAETIDDMVDLFKEYLRGEISMDKLLEELY